MKILGLCFCVVLATLGIKAHADFQQDIQDIMGKENSNLFRGINFDCGQVLAPSSVLCMQNVEAGRQCEKFYSLKVLNELRERCVVGINERNSENFIFNNCVIDKSKNSEFAMQEVRSVCRAISRNPSFLQKLRWGK